MTRLKDLGRTILNYFDLNSYKREADDMSKEEVERTINGLEQKIQYKEKERKNWSLKRKVWAYFDLNDIPPSVLKRELTRWREVYKEK